MNIKFKGHDSGNCRVYGTHNKKLYCLMEGYKNHGYMGLFYCSRDGEPDSQVNCDYTFENFFKEKIESIPTRLNGVWGDSLIMELLGIEKRTWNY